MSESTATTDPMADLRDAYETRKRKRDQDFRALVREAATRQFAGEKTVDPKTIDRLEAIGKTFDEFEAAVKHLIERSKLAEEIRQAEKTVKEKKTLEAEIESIEAERAIANAKADSLVAPKHERIREIVSIQANAEAARAKLINDPKHEPSPELVKKLEPLIIKRNEVRDRYNWNSQAAGKLSEANDLIDGTWAGGIALADTSEARKAKGTAMKAAAEEAIKLVPGLKEELEELQRQIDEILVLS
jgi:hypothetical protein